MGRLLLRLLGQRLPLTRGELRVPGPRTEVVLRRDAWAAPSVEAGCDEDVWFGLGSSATARTAPSNLRRAARAAGQPWADGVASGGGPGGQSGNPLSPHYDDLFELWRRGECVRLPWTDEEVRERGTEVLRLVPLN